MLPDELHAKLEDKKLLLTAKKPVTNVSDVNRVWGLHRALLLNAIKGADVGFEKQLQINGLGFKAAFQDNKIVFILGFSHKIDFELPEDVTWILIKQDKT